jgi:hypothetical protein
MGTTGELLDKWERVLSATLEEESFGQIIEATEGYQNLVNMIRNALNDKSDPKEKPMPVLSPDERTVALKLQKCFYARKQVLTNQSAGYTISLEDMRKITDSFAKLFKGERFPFDTLQLATINLGSDDLEDVTPFQDENRGNLLPCPTKLRPGEEVISLTINSIGLKDAMTYLDPFFNISVRDIDGNEIEQSQETPHPVPPRQDKSVQFDATVYIQTPLNTLSDDAAIFFEFRHWKPKKSKISVRCWSMLTLEEVRRHKATNLTLEIYAKPVSYTRKKFVRHSVKDLWTHVTLDFVKG